MTMRFGGISDHRPPLKRIEIGQRVDVDKRKAVTEALSGISPAERDRIWRTVEQAARGVSSPIDHDGSNEARVKRYLTGEQP